MFSFHKPKVYRSSTGCCICKAKSSSSRFTDSKKYEDDFYECFLLEEPRNGEICNACVLLVKRWKKLPAGSNRNWQHVVDARAGPGIKSLTKFKSKNKKKMKENLEKIEKIVKKKHVYLKPDIYREQSPAMSDDLTEEYMAGTGSKGSSRAGSVAGSDDTAVSDKMLNGKTAPIEENNLAHGWIDLTYFKRETICCGTIFKGPYGEVIVDPSLIKPCMGCLARQRMERERRVNARDSVSQNSSSASPSDNSASESPSDSSASASPAHSVDSSSSSVETTNTIKPVGKTFSDSSSDSGYDESSNQGIGERKIEKFVQTTTSSIVTKQQKPMQSQTPKIINVVVKNAQTKSIAVSETVRLKADLPIKSIPLEKLMCKPLGSLQSGNVNLTNSTSRPIAMGIVNNPLVDFAIHATARQSLAN